jgi:hypothetical protein
VQDAEELAVWLSEHVLPQGHPDEHLNAAGYQRLHDLGIEPPTPDRLDRTLASASSAFEERLSAEFSPPHPLEVNTRNDVLLATSVRSQNHSDAPRRLWRGFARWNSPDPFL